MRTVRSYRPGLEVLEGRALPSTVANLADAGAGSLRQAILDTPAGGTVDFLPGLTGTITLLTGELLINNDLTIAGPGVEVIAVSGNHASRVFDIALGNTVSISGLTIANGGQLAPGGFGGGVANFGTLTLSNMAVANSGARTSGGGIGNYGVLTIQNSMITGNSVGSGGSGGGIENYGRLAVQNSTITGNIAYSDPEGGDGVGAGIDNFTYRTASIDSTTIAGNHAGDGGGISNEGTLTVNNSTITGNTGGGGIGGIEGGGIDNYGGTLTVTNSTLTGNVAGRGGGISSEGRPYNTLIISNSTVSGNSAPEYGGGGIWISLTALTARNTILAGNTAPTSPDLAGSLTSSGFNLIGNSQGASGFAETDLLNVDARLGSLRDNGGPTQTMALMVGSPALNAGDPAQLGVADQRGVVRSGGVNIGAYQASASALLLSAPGTVTAGTAFDITVMAVDPFGQTAVGYAGTVHFVASNGAMANYMFTAADAGLHMFTGLLLRRAQTLTVTGTDTTDASVTGSTTFTITPAAADHLVFLQQPSDTVAGHTISPAVAVAVVDQFGNFETGDNSDTVTLSLGNDPGGGTLSGTLTVTVMSGVATFSDLSIDIAGVGYTLHATVGGSLPDIDSNAFNVTM
jgi:hypothetical protein